MSIEMNCSNCTFNRANHGVPGMSTDEGKSIIECASLSLAEELDLNVGDNSHHYREEHRRKGFIFVDPRESGVECLHWSIGPRLCPYQRTNPHELIVYASHTYEICFDKHNQTWVKEDGCVEYKCSVCNTPIEIDDISDILEATDEL